MSAPIVNVNGHVWMLLPQRAIWWPAQACLIIADPHFGKAATFRALGVPVPAGTTQGNLERLDTLLDAWPVKRLIVLGDFLHGPTGRSAAMMASLAAWRAKRPDLHCVLVRGNHDDRAGDPPSALRFEIVDEPYVLAGVACWHYPPAESPPNGAAYALGGHVHPVTVLRGRGRERLRLPCFDLGPTVGVLPAFGEFTGGWNIEAAPGHRLFAVAGDAVVPLQPTQSAQQLGVS